MHVSEQIEIYCTKIRKKFYSNRKMSFEQKKDHVRKSVVTLNFGEKRKLNPDFILRILCLDQDPIDFN